MYKGLSAVFFNKDLIEDKHLENPYDLVNAGTWTLDKFIEMCCSQGSDLNGDGVWEFGTDQYGLVVEGNAWRSMNSALDIHSAKIGEDGVPVILDPDEKLINAADKIQNMFLVNKDVLYNVSNDADMNNQFMANNILFMVHKLINMESLGDMEADFGIVPLPKYDENQESYYGPVAGATQIIFVPVNVNNPALSGKTLEALSYYSWKDVVPAYYESALQDRYSRDPDTVKMLNLIREGVTNGFDYTYATTINSGVSGSSVWTNFTVIGDAKQYGQAGAYNPASTIAKVKTAWESNIQKIIESYSDPEE